LNHVPGDAINSQRPIAVDANTLILLPLSGGIADMAGPADGFASVENDPQETSRALNCCRAKMSVGLYSVGTLFLI
jgi:hypothetical protein